MDDEEILKTVESMLGKNVEIVDCEKTSSVREEEVLLINGIPIQLDQDDSIAIKKALITGEVPPCDLLNQLLFRAGIMRQPVHLETSLSVKSSIITTEEVTIARDGRILDERSTETKEDNFYTSSSTEIWDPIKIIPVTEQCIPNISLTPSDQRVPKIAPLSQSTSSTTQESTDYIVTHNDGDDEIEEKSTTSHYQQTYPANSITSLPVRQNSLCTDSSQSSANSLNYSSRPASNNSISEVSSSTKFEQPTGSPVKWPSKTFNQKSKVNQSISCDSGHDDLFSSLDQSGLVHTPNSLSSCCELSADELDFVKNADADVRSTCTERKMSLMKIQPQQKLPTIFGTVADRCPKDGVNRRGFPQTQSNLNAATEFCSPDSDELGKGSDLDDNALVYRDGNLISGSLDALLQHMVPTSDYYPDKSYLFAFLLSARLFIRPHELLTKIIQLCDIQQSLTPSNQSQPTSGTQDLSRFAKHFVELLTEWIETFPYDFRDERLMQQVRSMTQKCIAIDGNLRKDVSAMLQNLLHRLNVLDQYEEYLGRMNIDRDDLTSSSSSSSGHLAATSNTNSFSTSTSATSTGDITELCPNPTLLSHQLTHIELERLSHIGPEEFVQAFAKENPHLETSFNDMKKTRNLESYVQWFNRLSYLVATEIVKHPKKKQRVRVVEYWIETGRECFNIGNFNSLMAIIAGLNMSPISRLKKTWAKVQSAKFSVLEHQMDPTSNFNSYRSTLKAAMWRSAGATDERQRIVIPFFSLLVKDLYFLNEGCSNKLPNGHINFDKFWQLAKQVTEFIAWKQVTCTFEKLPKVTLFLQTNHVLNENTLAMASFECEPPDNQHEKDRYKLLKSEQNQQQQH
ncbi:Ras-GEF domain-containing family member 1B [Pseudolycoriella hygida]|uniref:Ras-GEF domain-containing family member 1B n=1 Tax=Pseudolycoriella hygida TaxID=35572 RepID=A0A9Q0S2X1_9DIPT|nr:Ras-GEF domain-containing family member 1B [Pseudolycoriella hygida]